MDLGYENIVDRSIVVWLFLAYLIHLAITNRVNKLYTARPTRIYFIGRDGRVLYNSGIGPFGFSPDRLELVIEEYLASG